MKQLNLFDDSLQSSESSLWKLYVDGASRNNPGPSGAGIYIEKDGVIEIKEGYYLGIKTNNQAEYLALLLGLFILAERIKEGDRVHIVSDSQLLVRQLTDIYKVRQLQLQSLYIACKGQMQKLKATIAHVLRDENSEADAMANYGIDHKKKFPHRYSLLLRDHGIII